jgi:hypothetical protein
MPRQISEYRSLTRQVSPFTHRTVSGGGIQKFGQHLDPPPSILLQEQPIIRRSLLKVQCLIAMATKNFPVV